MAFPVVPIVVENPAGPSRTAPIPLLGGSLGPCCPGGVEDGACGPSVGLVPVGVSSSLRLEENTRSSDGSFSMHSTLDMGRQLNRI